MGRKGLLEKTMTSGRILRFLLDRSEAKEKLIIARRVLDKLFKSKKSDRKKAYRNELDNVLKYLVSHSTDLSEEKLKGIL